MDTAASQIVFVGGTRDGKPFPGSLLNDPRVRLLRQESLAELAGNPNRDVPQPNVIVVGPEIEDPFAIGRIRDACPSTQIVFVADPRRMPRLRAALPFLPALSDAWTIGADAPEEDIRYIVLQADASARDRQAAARALNRMNQQIASSEKASAAVRRSMQIALSERFMSVLLMQAPDPILALDRHGAVLSCNQAGLEMFSHLREPVIGASAWKLFPANFRPEFQSLLAMTTSRRRARAETLIATGGTLPREAELSLAPILDLENDVVGCAMIIRDISQLKATQRRLQKSQSELIHVSRLATMTHMGVAIAHELTQPLSAAANYLKGTQNLLGGLAVPAMVTEGVMRATAQVRRASDVIKRLRDFMSRGEAELKPEPLAPMIEEAIELAFLDNSRPDIALRIEIHPGIHTVLADRVQIQQVLLNLIRNALQAMANLPRPELTLRARPIDQDQVEIIVSDNGSGIAPEIAPRLFEPVTSDKPQGMGVGLAICRTIIESHGGEISIRSGNPGTECRFTLRSSA